MLTFRANGSVDFSPGAVVDMTYRIENGQLILPPETKNGPEQYQQLEFRGDNQLRLIAKAGGQSATMNLTRRGTARDAANPILGEWVQAREIQGRKMEAHWIFYPGGRGLLLLPFMTQPGRFSIHGTSMRLELPRHPPAEGKFQIEGDILTTPSPSGGGYRFARY
jgi:hypothetical protein